MHSKIMQTAAWKICCYSHSTSTQNSIRLCTSPSCQVFLQK